MGDSCIDLLLFSFSPLAVVLLVIKYSFIFLLIGVALYGLLSIYSQHKRLLNNTDHSSTLIKNDSKILNWCLVFYLLSTIATGIYWIIFTIYSTTYDNVEADPHSIFDTRQVDTDTIVDEIDKACDIDLEHIDDVLNPILFFVLGLHVTLVIVIYILRLLFEFREISELSLTKTNRYILIGLLSTFLFLLLLNIILRISILDSVGDWISWVTYLLYLVSMGYVCKLYFNKLVESTNVNEMAGIAGSGSNNMSSHDEDDIIVNGSGSATKGGKRLDDRTSLINKLTLYSVSVLIAYVSSLISVIVSGIGSYDDLSERHLLADFAVALAAIIDFLFNMFAMLWQFNIAMGAYNKCCMNCHNGMKAKCANKINTRNASIDFDDDNNRAGGNPTGGGNGGDADL